MSAAYCTLKTAIICKLLAADIQVFPIFACNFFQKTFLKVKMYGS